MKIGFIVGVIMLVSSEGRNLGFVCKTHFEFAQKPTRLFSPQFHVIALLFLILSPSLSLPFARSISARVRCSSLHSIRYIVGFCSFILMNSIIFNFIRITIYHLLHSPWCVPAQLLHSSYSFASKLCVCVHLVSCSFISS